MSDGGERRTLANARRRRRAQLRVLVLSLLGLGLVMVALPTVVVLVVGLLPALTWYIVDLTPGRFAFRCIPRFNVAAVIPFLYQLWTRGNDITAAMDIVTDRFAWMSFLGAASAGWLVHHAVPAVVIIGHDLYAKHQTGAMVDLQAELEKELASAVAADGPPAMGADPGDAETESPTEEGRVPA